MTYEHIFNIPGHAESLVIMSESPVIIKQEVEDAITSGNYALNVDYAQDGELPEGCAYVYSVKMIEGDDVNDYEFSAEEEADNLGDISDILETAFADTTYVEADVEDEVVSD